MSDIVLTEEPFATPHSISEEIDVEKVKHAGDQPKNVGISKNCTVRFVKLYCTTNVLKFVQYSIILIKC